MFLAKVLSGWFGPRGGKARWNWCGLYWLLVATSTSHRIYQDRTDLRVNRVTAMECLTGVSVLLTAAFAKGYIYIYPGECQSGECSHRLRIKIRVWD